MVYIFFVAQYLGVQTPPFITEKKKNSYGIWHVVFKTQTFTIIKSTNCLHYYGTDNEMNGPIQKRNDNEMNAHIVFNFLIFLLFLFFGIYHDS